MLKYQRVTPQEKKKQTWSRPAIPAVSMAIEWKNIFGQTHIYICIIYIYNYNIYNIYRVLYYSIWIDLVDMWFNPLLVDI